MCENIFRILFAMILSMAAITVHADSKPASQAHDLRAAPLETLADIAIHGADGQDKDGSMSCIGYELALLHYEHRDYSMRGGMPVLKNALKPSSRVLRVIGEHVVIDAVADGEVNELAASLVQLGM
jgi:hypothetical protein